MSQFCMRTCRSSVCAHVAVIRPAIICRSHLRYFPVISPLFLRYFSVISPLFPAVVPRRVRPLRQQFASLEALGHPARGDDVELLLASPVLLPQRRQTTRVPAQTTGAIWREEARADDCHALPPSPPRHSSNARVTYGDAFLRTSSECYSTNQNIKVAIPSIPYTLTRE